MLDAIRRVFNETLNKYQKEIDEHKQREKLLVDQRSKQEHKQRELDNREAAVENTIEKRTKHLDEELHKKKQRITALEEEIYNVRIELNLLKCKKINS